MFDKLRAALHGGMGSGEHADTVANHISDLTERVEKLEAFLVPGKTDKADEKPAEPTGTQTGATTLAPNL